MRPKAALLVGLALLLPLPPVGADAPYPIRLEGASAPANQALGLTIVGPAADLGPNLLQNADFEQGIPPWQRINPLGMQGVATVDGGTALLRASQPSGSGVLYVSQQVAFPGNRPFRLTYRSVDEGAAPTTLIVLLRETHANGTTMDTRFTHLAPVAWTTYNWTWIPRMEGAKALTIYLQASMGRGLTQQVRYDDISLAAAPLISWSVPGGAVLGTGGLSAQVRFDRKGLQHVYANATDGGVPLWSAVGAFDVRNAEPTAALAASPASPVNLPLVLDATGSLDPDAPLVLQDPAFAKLGSTWQASDVEVGGKVAATALAEPRGGVAIAVTGPTKAGTVYVVQHVPLGRSQPATLTVRVQDNDGLAGYAFLLRESNGTARQDTVVSFPAAGAREQVLTVPWEPKLSDATQLSVYLRFRVNPGADAHVRFVQPRLLSGLTYAWSLDGEPLDGAGPTHTLLPRLPGAHVATVTVTDADGATATVSAPLNFTDLGFAWETPPPAVVPLAPPTPLGLGTLRRSEGSEEQLTNGGFGARRDWTFVADEVGGNATWTVQSEGGRAVARIDARAARAGSVYLQQDAGRLCLQVPCTFAFDYRSGTPLDTLLRERNATGAPTDLHLRLPPSPAWRHVEEAWSPSANATRLTVYLRALLKAGENASVEFRAVSLQPSLRVDAAVAGPAGARLAGGNLSPANPGTHVVRVEVANPYGQAGVFERDLLALPVAVFPVPEGLALRWRAWEGALRVLDEAGATVWSVDLANATAPRGVAQFRSGGQTFARLPAGNGTLVLEADAAQGVFTLVALRAAFPGSLLDGNVTLARSGWHNLARVRFHTPNDALLGGVARAFDGAREVASAPLVRSGQELAADVRLPLGLSGRDYRIAVEFRDGWGATASISDVALHAAPNPAFAGGLALLALALLVAGYRVGRVVWRRRRA